MERGAAIDDLEAVIAQLWEIGASDDPREVKRLLQVQDRFNAYVCASVGRLDASGAVRPTAR